MELLNVKFGYYCTKVCNIEYKTFIAPKQNSSVSEKMTFLKLHPIQPFDIKSMSFDLRKVYFHLLATSENVQIM